MFKYYFIWFLIDSLIIIQVLNENISLELQQTVFPLATKRALNIENLEDLINTLDKLNVCYGTVLANKHPNVKASFGYQYHQVNGYWKHINCTKIILENR